MTSLGVSGRWLRTSEGRARPKPSVFDVSVETLAAQQARRARAKENADASPVDAALEETGILDRFASPRRCRYGLPAKAAAARSGVKPASTASIGASAATLLRNPSGFTTVVGAMPHLPASRPAHDSARLAPSAVVRPTPVTTTRGVLMRSGPWR